MSNLYSAGCKHYLNVHPNNAATNSLYGDCIVLTRLSNFAGLIGSCLLIFCTILYRYTFTPFFLRKHYRANYKALNARQQKKFRLNHMDFILKILSLIFILRPAYSGFLQGKQWSDPYYNGSDFALGDAAFFATAILAALFIFQLLCEEETKPIDIIHHIGGLLIIHGYPAWIVSQPAIKIFTMIEARAMANICLLWVLFSDAYGALKISIMILRRCLSPATPALRRLYYFGFYSTLLMTVLEAIAVVYATYMSWDQMQTLPRLSIIFLQILFTWAKTQNILPFHAMYRQQREKSAAYTGLDTDQMDLVP